MDKNYISYEAFQYAMHLLCIDKYAWELTDVKNILLFQQGVLFVIK